jgi:hypothetical protein
VTVSGNWRITFRIEDGNVFDVDLTDYHKEGLLCLWRIHRTQDALLGRIASSRWG